MKNVRTVHVHHHARLVSLGVAVPGHMVARLKHLDLVARLGELAGDYRPGKACTDDREPKRGGALLLSAR